MSEKNLWTACRKKWPDIFLQRIETAVERGIPDLFYCHDGVMGWVEGNLSAPDEGMLSCYRRLKERVRSQTPEVALCHWRLDVSRCDGEGL